MILARKFARRVNVSWEILGLVLKIIPVSANIRRIERDNDNSSDRGRKLIDYIFYFYEIY